MTRSNPSSSIRTILLTLIQLIELPLVAVVAVMAIFTERLDPAYLTVGLALLLLPPLLRLLVAGRMVQPTLTLWPLLLLAALGGLTVYVTPAWEQTWPELVRLWAGIALCLAVINWMNPVGDTAPRQHGRQRLPWRFGVGTLVFFALCAGLTTIGLLALRSPPPFLATLPWADWAEIRQLSSAGSFNSNRVAGVAALAAPLAFALLFGPLGQAHTAGQWLGRLGIKLGSLALCTFFGAALLLTQSRGALLACGCAGLLILPFMGRRGWLALLVLGVIGAGALIDLRSDDLGVLLLERDSKAAVEQSSNFLLQDRNLHGRWILWQRALHGIADAPLTGMGLGAFAALSQAPYPAVAAFVPDPDMSHVHNLILQVGLDLGLPGLILFVTLLGMAVVGLVQLVRLTRAGGALHSWSLGLLGSFVAYLIYNTFDALTLGARPALAAWVLFGLWIGGAAWVQRAGVAQMRPVVGAQWAVAEDEEEEDDDDDEEQEDEEEGLADALDRDSWDARAWAATAGDRQ